MPLKRKGASTVRMSMLCPEMSPTPVGMHRHVTKRSAARTMARSTRKDSQSKLTRRRAATVDDGSSQMVDRENRPPDTPRHRRRLFTQPSLADITVESPSPPPAVQPSPRRPLREQQSRPASAPYRHRETPPLSDRLSKRMLEVSPLPSCNITEAGIDKPKQLRQVLESCKDKGVHSYQLALAAQRDNTDPGFGSSDSFQSAASSSVLENHHKQATHKSEHLTLSGLKENISVSQQQQKLETPTSASGGCRVLPSGEPASTVNEQLVKAADAEESSDDSSPSLPYFTPARRQTGKNMSDLRRAIASDESSLSATERERAPVPEAAEGNPLPLATARLPIVKPRAPLHDEPAIQFPPLTGVNSRPLSAYPIAENTKQTNNSVRSPMQQPRISLPSEAKSVRENENRCKSRERPVSKVTPPQLSEFPAPRKPITHKMMRGRRLSANLSPRTRRAMGAAVSQGVCGAAAPPAACMSPRLAVARWLMESPLWTVPVDEEDVIVLASDDEADVSEFLSVSQRAEAKYEQQMTEQSSAQCTPAASVPTKAAPLNQDSDRGALPERLEAMVESMKNLIVVEQSDQTSEIPPQPVQLSDNEEHNRSDVEVRPSRSRRRRQRVVSSDSSESKAMPPRHTRTHTPVLEADGSPALRRTHVRISESESSVNEDGKESPVVGARRQPVPGTSSDAEKSLSEHRIPETSGSDSEDAANAGMLMTTGQPILVIDSSSDELEAPTQKRLSVVPRSPVDRPPSATEHAQPSESSPDAASDDSLEQFKRRFVRRYPAAADPPAVADDDGDDDFIDDGSVSDSSSVHGRRIADQVRPGPVTPAHRRPGPITPAHKRSGPITPAHKGPRPITKAHKRPGPITPAHKKAGPVTPAHKQPGPVTPAHRLPGATSALPRHAEATLHVLATTTTHRRPVPPASKSDTDSSRPSVDRRRATPLPSVRRAGRPPASESAAKAERAGRQLSFLSSLAEYVPMGWRRDGDAEPLVRQFRANRTRLANTIFTMINQRVFNRQLPDDFPIQFNARLRRTAGYCYSRSSATDGGRSARVELSDKVVDCAERLRDTLVHELCHAAAWVVSGQRGGHGPVWRGWADAVRRQFPELPPVSRCHSYQIHCKYTYQCTGCGQTIGRHSKSLNTERKVCGRCGAKFQCLLTPRPARGRAAAAATVAAGTAVQPATPATPRAATPFALFVKHNYGSVKKTGALRNHGDVMRELSRQFSAAKITANAAKDVES